MISDPASRAGAILDIDLGGIVENWRRLARQTAPAQCAAVVKANAYGLGLGPVARALAVVQLPLHLNWSAPGRVFDLGSRADRARVYEIVLQEGRPADILAYVDGALLADLWGDLILPRAVRSAWSPLLPGSGKAAA